MAGFAVFMTIVTWGLFLLVGAAIVSFALVAIAKRRLPVEIPGRSAVLALCARTPFFGLLWLVAALLIHVVISNVFAHQDCGLSGDPYVTLPNGYVLGSHNTYDGYIKAPGFETSVPVVGPGYVRSIISLQLADGYFTGTQFDFETSKLRHFVFDTRTQEFHVTDVNPHQGSAAEEGTGGEMSYWNMYAQYSHHWPNTVLVILVLVGESWTAYWLWTRWRSAWQSVAEHSPSQI